MAATPQYNAALGTLQQRGYGQGDLDTFLSQNPGDIGRIGSAFPGQMGAPTTGAGGSGEATGAPGAAAPAASDAMAGLNKVVDTSAGQSSAAAPGTAALSAIAGGVGSTPGVIDEAPGSLRPLGTRIPPMDSMALAGLQRRVY